jgi:hypothetical protein
MTIKHKGECLIVAEGQDNRVEFRFGGHRETPKSKGFNAACKEAVTWMLKNAGGMKGDYER